MAEQRLPVVNSDDGLWGTLLVQYLTKEHYNINADNPTENGGHQKVTIRAGTTGAAPLTFSGTSGGTAAALLTTPVAGSMEYDANAFYLTQGSVRKKIAIYDDTNGVVGDTYYRDSTGALTRVGIGTGNQQLTVNSAGLPVWASYVTTTKTSGYTVTANDTVIFANASSAAVAITLPAASSLNGYRFYIKRIDNTYPTNIVTVTRSGSDTIDGQVSVTLDLQYTALIVISNGTNWFIF